MITNPGQVSGTDRALDRIFGPIGRAWDRIFGPIGRLWDRVFGPVGRAWDRLMAPTERYRRPFRRWRRGRPFTAGISILLAGVEISLVTQSALGKLLSMGVPGISTLFISVFLVIFAVTIWFFPAYRVFSGIATIMIALLSLVATNLGGFLIGFLLAMFGGAFAVAWAPRAAYTADTRRQRRSAARTQAADLASQSAEMSAIETEEPLAEPVAEPAARPTDEAEAGAEDPEHERNTEIIEHYARPDEAAAAPPEPAPEEE